MGILDSLVEAFGGRRSSAVIDDYSYDKDSQTLDIAFTNGRTHSYNVPPEVAQQLDRAPSQGRYFNANIREPGNRGRRRQ